jgi:hypothetical protein
MHTPIKYRVAYLLSLSLTVKASVALSGISESEAQSKCTHLFMVITAVYQGQSTFSAQEAPVKGYIDSGDTVSGSSDQCLSFPGN